MIKHHETIYYSNIKKMSFIQFFFWLHFFSAVLIPFYQDWGNLDFAQILFLNSWFMFCIFLFEVPTGTIADYFNRKISLILSSVFGVIGIIVYTSQPNFIIFMIGETILAISFTLMSGADSSMVYDSLLIVNKSEDSKRCFAKIEAYKLSGILTGAIFGGFIAKFSDVRMPFFLQFIPFTVSFAISLTLKEPPIINKKASTDNYFKFLNQGIKFFFNHKILLILTLDLVLVNALSWLIIWFYQPLLKSVDIDIEYYGFIHSIMCVSQILFINNAIFFENLFKSKKNVLIFSTFIAGLSFIVLGTIESVYIVIPFIIIASGFGLARQPLFTSYMNKYIESYNRATILSVTSMFRTFACFIINSISGFLSEWSLFYPLIVSGIILTLFSFFSRIKDEYLID